MSYPIAQAQTDSRELPSSAVSMVAQATDSHLIRPEGSTLQVLIGTCPQDPTDTHLQSWQVHLKQAEDGVVSYHVIARGQDAPSQDDAAVLRDYFTLETSLSGLSQGWTADARFRSVYPYFTGKATWMQVTRRYAWHMSHCALALPVTSGVLCSWQPPQPSGGTTTPQS